MSTHFILFNWTEQGIKAVKASPKRLSAAKRLAKDFGLKFRDFHMTMGQYDGIATIEARWRLPGAFTLPRMRVAVFRPGWEFGFSADARRTR